MNVKLSSCTAIAASASYCGPRVTFSVLMWPTEQFEFETPGLGGGTEAQPEIWFPAPQP